VASETMLRRTLSGIRNNANKLDWWKQVLKAKFDSSASLCLNFDLVTNILSRFYMAVNQ